MKTNWSNQVILNRFRIDRLLDGENEVYRAWDEQTGQAVAMHLLPELPDDETGHLLESRGMELARFSNPGASSYLGYFEFSSTAFWVESYLDAPTLRDVLASTPQQPLALIDTLIYLKCLSATLSALHKAGWAYANLRPENIRVGRTGKIIITDLFSARPLGEIPQVASRYTPADKFLSPAFDVFSLGCIAYEMLAGVLPDDPPDLRKINPNTPEYLARQMPRSLDRYQSTRVANATEFFLTACMACQIDPESVPNRIPLDSSSALVLAEWNFLPPLNPPPQIIPLKGPIVEKRRPAPGLWLPVGIAGLLVGIFLIWYFGKPEQLIPLAAATATDLPAAIPVSNDEIKGIPTIAAVPSLDAPEGLGGKIVFTCTRSNLNQLCMVAPTGGKISRVTSDAAHDYYPNFSPAGNMVLYASNRAGSFNLYVKLLNSDILTQVTNGIGEVSSAAFSADGNFIIFSNSVDGKPSGLWQVSREGKNPQKIYEGEGNITSPVWSPNGKNIAFAMSSAADLTSYNIYILDPLTQIISAITKGKLANVGGSVDWSPDGRSLVLFAGVAGDKNIFLFDIISEHIRQLTNGGNNAAPVFSPDGRWIAFNSQRSGSANIFIMKPDGSDVRQLTNDTEPDWQPKWGR